MFADYVKNGMTVADLGCGMGFFSIGMAKMIGDDGIVFSIDVQQQMLDVLEKRAKRAGMLKRIRTYRCSESSIGIPEPVDFVLAFWMVHETPSAKELFNDVHSILKPGGKFFIAEPKMHVSVKIVQDYINVAKEVGLRLVDEPRIRLSRAVVFER
ncbi:MAG: class I SAM-dependent methyltransferase [Candidatus Electryoneaceae bacterium]|nr:class I SAM-dependent methyltransferase [Candidatus Electryoneaceae bacterium]